MEPSNNNSKKEQKIFHLTIPFDQIDIGRFTVINSLVYVVESVFYYPFDVLRTKYQVKRESLGFLQSFQILKSMDIRSSYAGFFTYTIGSLPSHFAYFFSYNLMKDELQKINEKWETNSEIKGRQAMWVSLVSGASADFISNFLFVPVEVVVQRIQIQNTDSQKNYKNSFDAVKSIYRNEGIKGFYQGFGASLLTYAISSAIWWAVYEQSKISFSDNIFTSTKHVQSSTVHVEQSAPVQILSGAMAGLFHSFLSNPMDVIKTRLQTQHHSQELEEGKVKILYKNSWDAFKIIMRDEGPKAFIKGVTPRVLSSVFFSCWFGFIYEKVLYYSKKSV